jgi:hypothetical protein
MKPTSFRLSARRGSKRKKNEERTFPAKAFRNDVGGILEAVLLLLGHVVLRDGTTGDDATLLVDRFENMVELLRGGNG